MSMTSHERVMTALNHRRADRPPLNYYGTEETTRKLLDHLRLESLEDLLCYFGADMRYVGSRYVGPDCFSGQSGYAHGDRDMWGVVWDRVSNRYATYNEVVHHPLAGAQTVAEVEAYDWPSPDWLSVSHLADEIRAINQVERRAIVFPAGGPFETMWYLRGLERTLIDLVERPDIADVILGKVTDFFVDVAMRAVEASAGQIDIMWSSSDVGIQTGMMMAPDTWRRRIKPFQRRFIEPFSKMGMKTRYHTDGSVAPIIEDLIEMGLDLLDPIQPGTAGMEAEELAARFGGRLSFYGGLDTQHLLPHGTAGQVEADVLRLIDVLGGNGGYVVAASNAVQPDVPVENVLALYETAREYRY
ncbi:MAG: hypothetical protein CMJ49_06075 [Planctomycetaceae bacterium]|nr:hypothetical protein [Planctomycetaceae bacterium]